MSITDFSKIFHIQNSEYGYTIEDCQPVKYGECIKLYIPKLMGAINTVGIESISSSNFFSNTLECRPSVIKKVQLINYIDVPVRSSVGWENKTNENGIIPKGTMFIVEFINGNIQKPFTTTK